MHIGLTPEQFWRPGFTPRELDDMVAGYNARQEDELWRAAWLARVIVSAWVEKPPTIDELLGKWVRH